MSKNKKTMLFVIGALLVISVATGISYALWTITRTQEDSSIVTTGCFELEFAGGTALDLSGEFPVTDAEGLAKDPYHFTIRNTCSTAANVDIKLLMTNENTMGLNHVKVAINGGTTVAPQLLSAFGNGTTTTPNISNTKILGQAYIPGNATQEYDLRVWMDESVTKDQERNTKFAAKIEIEGAATNPLPSCSFAANVIQPELENGLIPVVYEDNKWVKADTLTEWFDYCNQMWANAVTVKAENRSTYASAAAGTEIPMDDINTMWVWIPRYEYQTNNLTYVQDNTLHNQYAGGIQTEPGEININFVSKDTTTASASNFIIHPAFTFGTQELSGMWVAKFEMSPQTGTTCATTSNKTNCDITTFAPEIKPNVKQWRNARVGTFFTTIQTQMNGSNGTATYGISNSDTHMMKNMEWGAAAYLSQSKYGKYGNTTYTGADKEVAVNNCQTYLTGIGGDTVSAIYSSATCTTNTYETAKGQAASTTGNIYGIYDMSGGTSEYVMGVMKESTNTEVAVGYYESYNSGFSGKLYNGIDYEGTYGGLKDIDAKYYDVYDYVTTWDDTAAYERGHQGDGTTEVVGWYQDYAYFVGYSNPWFRRGGSYGDGIIAGVFFFNHDYGHASDSISTRAVLVSSAS